MGAPNYMIAAGAITLFTMNLTADSLQQKYPGKYVAVLCVCDLFAVTILYVPTDLTQAEREVLVNIRKRKLELLQEISQLKDELTEVNTDIESMDTEEG